MSFFFGPSPFMLLFGSLSSLFWLVLLGVIVWALVRWLTRRSAALPPFVSPHGIPVNQPSAMEILRQRYARGEINAETFDHMRERLEGSQPQSQQSHI